MSVDRLSSKEYWDSVLAKANLPRVNSSRVYNYYVTMTFIDDILRNANKKTFLEIGCGSSGWLPFFANKYGYTVSGLDYSAVGCRIAEQNLKLLKIDYDQIHCQDIFTWNSSQKYDVIFTYGVVEHFEHPKDVLKVCRDHLNDDGIIITLVPNLGGLIGFLSRIFVMDIYRMHKVITREDLLSFHRECGFENIKTNYAGILALGVIPWSRSQFWLFKKGSLQRKISLKCMSIVDRILSVLFRATRIDLPSRHWSPYIISVMRNPPSEVQT